MAGIRGWLAAAVACGLLVPAGASAASPGDRVAFEIPDSDRGDTYAISVEEQKAADGVDDTDDPGISGEFRMPKLGWEAREVTVLIEVVRAADGSRRTYESRVDYTPGHTAGARPVHGPPQPQPQSQPRPVPAASAPAAAPHPPVTVAPPPAPAAPRPAAPVGGSKSNGKTARKPQRIVLALRRRAARHTRRHARRARRRARPFRSGPDPVPPKVRSLSAPRDTRVDVADDSFPGLGYSVAWKLLAAVAAAGLLLPFLVAARTRQIRPGNPPP